MPAEVIGEPLGISVRFSDGTSCMSYVGDTPNPVLARAMVTGLVDLVHPHGTVDSKSSVVSYLGAVRRLTDGLARCGFTGSAADLTRAKLAGYWMADQHVVREGQCRAMLARADDLGHVLRPEVRAFVDGRRFAVGKERGPGLLPYSEGEWERLVALCRSQRPPRSAATARPWRWRMPDVIRWWAGGASRTCCG
ncbi:hypothetical protein [Kitasatospora sp. NPDC093102]|uniref:hypothetical protein n=1 Tax=Kitasatospora sp. NPDC093102 TaxID=3155069 RepID=UPI003425F185